MIGTRVISGCGMGSGAKEHCRYHQRKAFADQFPADVRDIGQRHIAHGAPVAVLTGLMRQQALSQCDLGSMLRVPVSFAQINEAVRAHGGEPRESVFH